MTVEFVRDRITRLRMNKGVSEYQMSYDLGHSRGYVNNISSGKSLPSMTEFLAICEYFDITPAEFFNETAEDPRLLGETLDRMEQLDRDDLELVQALTRRLLEK